MKATQPIRPIFIGLETRNAEVIKKINAKRESEDTNQGWIQVTSSQPSSTPETTTQPTQESTHGGLKRRKRDLNVLGHNLVRTGNSQASNQDALTTTAFPTTQQPNFELSEGTTPQKPNESPITPQQPEELPFGEYVGSRKANDQDGEAEDIEGRKKRSYNFDNGNGYGHGHGHHHPGIFRSYYYGLLRPWAIPSLRRNNRVQDIFQGKFDYEQDIYHHHDRSHEHDYGHRRSSSSSSEEYGKGKDYHKKHHYHVEYEKKSGENHHRGIFHPYYDPFFDPFDYYRHRNRVESS